ncbi:MAG TPA: phosphotransferase [Stackebrandtia sp.]|jgi:aminoglycoside phosphotransferase|uniref:phosphotransferase n=1 Tax=Stackebrandtia sp. TaxID=2023065 RepID=UPI002D6E563A|nr:phosphotransferase [Stackebrandtia sp.]HZE39149.1 phosphotransferase [Stackebrandtia sp.]
MSSPARERLRRTYAAYRWRPVGIDTACEGAIFDLDGPLRLRVKIAEDADIAYPDTAPTAEAEKLRWLAAQGIPVPEVIDAGECEYENFLVTRLPDGVAASTVAASTDTTKVADALADLAATVHALDRAACPFDRCLNVTMPRACAAAAMAELDVDVLPAARTPRGRTRLLVELMAFALSAGREEKAVCHGDLIPAHVLVDPDTHVVTGLAEAARLGVADRYTDLAALTRALPRPLADRVLYRYGEIPCDADRVRLYRDLRDFG